MKPKYSFIFNEQLQMWEVYQRYFLFWYRSTEWVFKRYSEAVRYTNLSFIQRAIDDNSPRLKSEYEKDRQVFGEIESE